MATVATFTIFGEMASGKNSREVVVSRASFKPMVIKSRKARDWWHAATLQLRELGLLRLDGEPIFTEPVRLTVRAFYASERPDLDGAVLKDVMQSRYTRKGKKRVRCIVGLYDNDRLVREEHYYHAIDAENPRAEVVVEALAP
jgi:hypothetical protein